MTGSVSKVMKQESPAEDVSQGCVAKALWPVLLTVIRAAATVAFLSSPLRAEDVTMKDIQVIGRTLGFMVDARSGTMQLGIVYLRGSPESVRQATAMQATLGTGLSAGKLVLQPKMVPADELSTIDHVEALFIVPDASSAAAAGATAAGRLHVPIISKDVACAAAGQCVVAFQSEPLVEIVFSPSAAANEGVRFTAAFRMLVKQF